MISSEGATNEHPRPSLHRPYRGGRPDVAVLARTGARMTHEQAAVEIREDLAKLKAQLAELAACLQEDDGGTDPE